MEVKKVNKEVECLEAEKGEYHSYPKEEQQVRFDKNENVSSGRSSYNRTVQRDISKVECNFMNQMEEVIRNIECTKGSMEETTIVKSKDQLQQNKKKNLNGTCYMNTGAASLLNGSFVKTSKMNHSSSNVFDDRMYELNNHVFVKKKERIIYNADTSPKTHLENNELNHYEDFLNGERELKVNGFTKTLEMNGYHYGNTNYKQGWEGTDLMEWESNEKDSFGTKKKKKKLKNGTILHSNFIKGSKLNVETKERNVNVKFNSLQTNEREISKIGKIEEHDDSEKVSDSNELNGNMLNTQDIKKTFKFDTLCNISSPKKLNYMNNVNNDSSVINTNKNHDPILQKEINSSCIHPSKDIHSCNLDSPYERPRVLGSHGIQPLEGEDSFQEIPMKNEFATSLEFQAINSYKGFVPNYKDTYLENKMKRVDPDGFYNRLHYPNLTNLNDGNQANSLYMENSDTVDKRSGKEGNPYGETFLELNEDAGETTLEVVPEKKKETMLTKLKESKENSQTEHLKHKDVENRNESVKNKSSLVGVSQLETILQEDQLNYIINNSKKTKEFKQNYVDSFLKNTESSSLYVEDGSNKYERNLLKRKERIFLQTLHESLEHCKKNPKMYQFIIKMQNDFTEGSIEKKLQLMEEYMVPQSDSVNAKEFIDYLKTKKEDQRKHSSMEIFTNLKILEKIKENFIELSVRESENHILQYEEFFSDEGLERVGLSVRDPTTIIQEDSGDFRMLNKMVSQSKEGMNTEESFKDSNEITREPCSVILYDNTNCDILKTSTYMQRYIKKLVHDDLFHNVPTKKLSCEYKFEFSGNSKNFEIKDTLKVTNKPSKIKERIYNLCKNLRMSNVSHQRVEYPLTLVESDPVPLKESKKPMSEGVFCKETKKQGNTLDREFANKGKIIEGNEIKENKEHDVMNKLGATEKDNNRLKLIEIKEKKIENELKRMIRKMLNTEELSAYMNKEHEKELEEKKSLNEEQVKKEETRIRKEENNGILENYQLSEDFKMIQKAFYCGEKIYIVDRESNEDLDHMSWSVSSVSNEEEDEEENGALKECTNRYINKFYYVDIEKEQNKDKEDENKKESKVEEDMYDPEKIKEENKDTEDKKIKEETNEKIDESSKKYMEEEVENEESKEKLFENNDENTSEDGEINEMEEKGLERCISYHDLEGLNILKNPLKDNNTHDLCLNPCGSDEDSGHNNSIIFCENENYEQNNKNNDKQSVLDLSMEHHHDIKLEDTATKLIQHSNEMNKSNTNAHEELIYSSMNLETRESFFDNFFEQNISNAYNPFEGKHPNNNDTTNNNTPYQWTSHNSNNGNIYNFMNMHPNMDYSNLYNINEYVNTMNTSINPLVNNGNLSSNEINCTPNSQLYSICKNNINNGYPMISDLPNYISMNTSSDSLKISNGSHKQKSGTFGGTTLPWMHPYYGTNMSEVASYFNMIQNSNYFKSGANGLKEMNLNEIVSMNNIEGFPHAFLNNPQCKTLFAQMNQPVIHGPNQFNANQKGEEALGGMNNNRNIFKKENVENEEGKRSSEVLLDVSKSGQVTSNIEMNTNLVESNGGITSKSESLNLNFMDSRFKIYDKEISVENTERKHSSINYIQENKNICDDLDETSSVLLRRQELKYTNNEKVQETENGIYEINESKKTEKEVLNHSSANLNNIAHTDEFKNENKVKNGEIKREGEEVPKFPEECNPQTAELFMPISVPYIVNSDKKNTTNEETLLNKNNSNDSNIFDHKAKQIETTEADIKDRNVNFMDRMNVNAEEVPPFNYTSIAAHNYMNNLQMLANMNPSYSNKFSNIIEGSEVNSSKVKSMNTRVQGDKNNNGLLNQINSDMHKNINSINDLNQLPLNCPDINMMQMIHGGGMGISYMNQGSNDGIFYGGCNWNDTQFPIGPNVNNMINPSNDETALLRSMNMQGDTNLNVSELNTKIKQMNSSENRTNINGEGSICMNRCASSNTPISPNNLVNSYNYLNMGFNVNPFNGNFENSFSNQNINCSSGEMGLHQKFSSPGISSNSFMMNCTNNQNSEIMGVNQGGSVNMNQMNTMHMNVNTTTTATTPMFSNDFLNLNEVSSNTGFPEQTMPNSTSEEPVKKRRISRNKNNSIPPVKTRSRRGPGTGPPSAEVLLYLLEEEYFTVPDIAAIYGVHRTTVARWCHSRNILQKCHQGKRRSSNKKNFT